MYLIIFNQYFSRPESFLQRRPPARSRRGGWPTPLQNTRDAMADPQCEARVGRRVAIEPRAATMGERAWVAEKYRVGEARTRIRATSPPPHLRTPNIRMRTRKYLVAEIRYLDATEQRMSEMQEGGRSVPRVVISGDRKARARLVLRPPCDVRCPAPPPIHPFLHTLLLLLSSPRPPSPASSTPPAQAQAQAKARAQAKQDIM